MNPFHNKSGSHHSWVNVYSQSNNFLSKSTVLIVLDYRGLLDINMEQIVAECKSLRDKLARDTRLKDKLMQVLKRNELQLKQARDSLADTQQQHERTQAQVNQNKITHTQSY